MKLKPNRVEIELFKENLTQLLDKIYDAESEEHNKMLISNFLRETYYAPNHYINTKERSDLVIHNGQNRGSTVGVIIETKQPGNKWEMITEQNINVKDYVMAMIRVQLIIIKEIVRIKVQTIERLHDYRD